MNDLANQTDRDISHHMVCMNIYPFGVLRKGPRRMQAIDGHGKDGVGVVGI